MKNIKYYLFFILNFLVIFRSFSEIDTNQDTKLAKVSNYVTNLVNQGYKVLNDKTVSLEKRTDSAAKLIEQNLDINSMTNFTLGRYANQMSESQSREIKDLYKKLTINTYANISKNYNGQKLVVKKIVENSDTTFLVETDLYQKNQESPLNISYLVNLVDQKEDKFLILDVITNGVSIVASQRSEFTSVIKDSGIDSLIERLKQKISEQEKKYTARISKIEFQNEKLTF